MNKEEWIQETYKEFLSLNLSEEDSFYKAMIKEIDCCWELQLQVNDIIKESKRYCDESFIMSEN